MKEFIEHIQEPLRVRTAEELETIKAICMRYQADLVIHTKDVEAAYYCFPPLKSGEWQRLFPVSIIHGA